MAHIEGIVTSQHQYFYTDATKPVAFRAAALKKLASSILLAEADILGALNRDLNKSDFEGYMTELGMVLAELRYTLKHLHKWAKPRTVPTPITQFHARSFIEAEPYGVVLIVAPWNYPFQLSVVPLIGAIAAGNCAVVKPSPDAPHTSRLLAELISSVFPSEYITVVEGGQEKNSQLLSQRFDYIFFTGSVGVGKLVMKAASRHLTPVTLELGGKSPCVIDETADLKCAARRLAFGKFLNAGQTCVAPDYLLVQETIKERFFEHLREAVESFFPDKNYQDLPAIINERHFNRLLGLIKGEKIWLGGSSNPATRFIEPTILDEVSLDSPVMQEEIMGPILPVISFKELEEVITIVRSMPKPLALYLFSGDPKTRKRLFNGLSFGGGCINDTVIHLASPYLGFGGVGNSGMGRYHGKYSFDTFSHHKSILKKSNWFDLPIRYHPYTGFKYRLLRYFMK